MPPPRQPVRGKACKKAVGFCTRKVPNQKEKAVRSPVFPRFPHSRKFLCGKKFASLRQEKNFFQQRNPIFTAQKRILRRRNAPYEQFSRPLFNTSGSIFSLPAHHTGAEQGGIPNFLAAFPGLWLHSGTGAAGASVPWKLYAPIKRKAESTSGVSSAFLH